MRNVFGILLTFGIATVSIRAQEFRIATWQVGNFQVPRQTNATPAVDPPQIAGIANALGTLDADAIILYGISDGQALRRIADTIAPKKHSLLIHSTFRQSANGTSPLVGQPVGIFTRRERMAAKNVEWHDTGRIDLPGGFTFAAVRNGNNAVGIYVATFPGPLTNGISSNDGAYFARKRGYAADFLGHHTAFVASTYSEHPFATYLTGDILLAPKKPVNDGCADLLAKAGFRSVPVGMAQDKSALSIISGPHLNRVFDPVFTKNVEFMATRQIPVPGFDLPMVVCEITIKPAASAGISKPVRKPAPTRPPLDDLPPIAPVPAPPRVQMAATPPPTAPPAAAAANPPARSPVATNLGSVAAHNVDVEKLPADPEKKSAAVSNTPPWIWPVAIGGACGLLGVFIVNSRAARRRQTSNALARPMFVELNSTSRAPQTIGRSSSGAILSEATTATDNAHNGVWQSPSVRLGTNDSEAAQDKRAGLVPHLRQLMRERLFQWLSNQRSQLIESHENGTAQVLGLEERLEKIRDQFQDKLITQEQRIAQMDRELKEKEKQLNQSPKPQSPGSDSKSTD